jgi:hypothetical protein
VALAHILLRLLAVRFTQQPYKVMQLTEQQLLLAVLLHLLQASRLLLALAVRLAQTAQLAVQVMFTSNTKGADHG